MPGPTDVSSKIAALSPDKVRVLAAALAEKVERLELARREPIAVVGLACRFPGGANSVGEFWSLLRRGGDAIDAVPASRWNIDDYYSPIRGAVGKMYTRAGGFLKQWAPDKLDADFFGISPREARLVDPQQRLLLEVAWEALEDAAISPDSVRGTKTGVFVGIINMDFGARLTADGGPPVVDQYLGTGTGLSFPAGRLSYFLGTHGPSMAVATACSSSLVTLHLACESLRTGDCDLALAGGVNLMLSPVPFIGMCQLGSLAEDGRCRSFAADASGYGRGEGCGLVVLKRLSAAVRDGDPIYATIQGSAVNHGGASGGLTVPSGRAQEQLIRAALANAKVAGHALKYVEAHGAGTALGDPIEVQALALATAEGRAADDPLWIGAVKTNIGHLESAAGIAGFIKTVLSVQRGVIPATIHCEQQSPRIAWNRMAIRVASQEQPFPTDGEHYAGVSGFGISGINAHVVLGCAPQATSAERPDESIPQLGPILPLSANDETALRELSERWRDHLLEETSGTVADACATAQLGRAQLTHRLCVWGETKAELAVALSQWQQGGGAQVVSGTRVDGRLAFVFAGQGGQWFGMGRALMERSAAFRAAWLQCEDALRPHLGLAVGELILSPEPMWLERIDLVQPVLFTFGVACARALMAGGVRPSAVIGHSTGEVAAAHIAGALSLKDAARVVALRSKLMRRTSGQGAMLVTELDRDAAERRCFRDTARIAVGAINGPRSTVLSGDPAILREIASELESESVFHRFVKVDTASHSPLMDPVAAELERELADLQPVECETLFYSSLLGRRASGSELGPVYWARNLREPVQFWQTFKTAVEEGHAIFAELGPHPVLESAMKDGLDAQDRAGRVFCMGHREQDESNAMQRCLGTVWAAGSELDWQRINSAGRRMSGAPCYAWQRARHWPDSIWDSKRVRSAELDLAGLRPHASKNGYWRADCSLEQWPWLDHHRVGGVAAVPGALWLSWLLSVASPEQETAVVEHFRLSSLLALPDDACSEIQLEESHQATNRRYTFSSRRQAALDAAAEVHASGQSADVDSKQIQTGIGLRELTVTCDEQIDCAELYTRAQAQGITYGAEFRRVSALRRAPTKVWAQIDNRGGIFPELDISPSILDACFQIAGLLLNKQEDRAWLPVGVELAQLRRAGGSEFLHAVVEHVESSTSVSSEELTVNLYLFDADASPRGVLTGLRFRPLERSLGIDAGCLELEWETSPPPALAVKEEQTWLVIGPDAGLVPALLDRAGSEGQAAYHVDSSTLLVGEMGTRVKTLAAHLASLGPLSRIVYLAVPVAAAVSASYDAAEVWRTQREHLESLTVIVRALAAGARRDHPSVLLFTQNAQSVLDSDTADRFASAAVWGWAASARHEHPELGLCTIDLPERDVEVIDATWAECRAKRDDGEDRFAWRDGARYRPRIVRRSWDTVNDASPPGSAAGAREFRLDVTQANSIDAMRWRVQPRSPLQSGEVRIEVKAASLNFRDVLQIMGRLPEDIDPEEIGSECAGVVTEVGPDVSGLSVGTRVVAIGTGCFRSDLCINQLSVLRMPAELDFSTACSVPVAYMTAYAALVEIARLRAGDTVLIHSAAGGTGMAALQVAQMLGVKVFATAGTPEKRAWLTAAGVENVYDSRSLDFSEHILRDTNGRGVDAVLNSLSGEAIHAGLNTLAHFGRFVEIGKRDIYGGSAIDLAPFRRNLSFHALDLVGMRERDFPRFRALAERVLTLVARGELPGPFVTVWPVSDVRSAFLSMAQGKHQGKIALTFAERGQLLIEPPRHVLRRPEPNATWLITGGGGGLGLVTAEWLLTRGIGRVVLIGRRAQPEAVRRLAQRWQVEGKRVDWVSADVSDEQRLAGGLAALEVRLDAISGVIHAAGVLRDATVMNAEVADLEHVIRAKLLGAVSVVRVLGDQSPAAHVFFSSASALFGSPGQAFYSAANAAVDAFARHLSHSTLAVSLNWGPWRDVGLAAAEDNRSARLENRGFQAIGNTEGMAALERALDGGSRHVGVVEIDVRQWSEFYSNVASAPYYSRLAQSGARQITHSWRHEVEELPPPERLSRLEQLVTERLAKVLRRPAESIDHGAALAQYGLDSLLSLEFRNLLESGTRIKLSTTLVFAFPTVRELARHLAERMELVVTADSEPTAGQEAAAREAQVLEMTDDEAELQLLTRLEQLENDDA